ncbi:hypothetical protein AC579_1884 [Pseudocercospora musae]|uniref:WSC domain-containing protein n=1 Tax=Pseudocercospora musae TaxID=113226 RepID=A0A139HZD8_9PEZI|nr:hypothetical protein AC579_1884 [Pseudocercospora musae]
MRFSSLLFAAIALAQQYAGDTISAGLPTIAGAEVAFFKIPDTTGANDHLTLINYYSHGSDGTRIVEANIQRAIIVLHGLLRDPWNYENDMLTALAQAHAGNANISTDSVAVIAPYFTNGADKTFGYPWTEGLEAGRGSTSNALVWSGSQWSAGANNQYPVSSTNTSSFFVLDTLISYFDDKTLFPNLKQIVVAGHSMGGQMAQRYASVSTLQTASPVTYWIGNPNSYAWFSTDRPLSTAACAKYDKYREGYADYDTYVRWWHRVARPSATTMDRNKSRADRHERFFFYIKAFAPSCTEPAGANCDTVDLINVSHDNGLMFNSPAGQARLFTDNFYGDGSRAFDFGYPRKQEGDNPYPDPSQVGISGKTITGNWNGMTYQGCWTNQDPITPSALPILLYDNSGNSIEGCTSGCQGAGYAIAGVQNSTQCLCGNALNSQSAVLVVDSSCRLPCPGNGYEICGSNNRLSIFSATYPAFE